MTPQQFVEKWKRSSLGERQASQEFFLDLCRLLGQPTPAGHDSEGAEYAFERGVAVTGGASSGAKGDRGFADVWWRRKFGWEFKRKGKHATLDDAYRQLLNYREALENPPLLIVSDIARIEIHTNFTGTVKTVHRIDLEDLASPESLDLLRRVFTDPGSFKPETTPEKVTTEVAARIGAIAEGLRARGHDPHDAAHFLMKCMFCLFAEDIGLLPNDLFERLLEKHRSEPKSLAKAMTGLFALMAVGGPFGLTDVPHFNGGLFREDDAPALELTYQEIRGLLHAAAQDWGSVEPAVFGTLFERSLDPRKRSQIGAHYTSKADILLVVEPVIVDPLRREWERVREGIEQQIERRQKARTKQTKAKANDEIDALLNGFLERLSSVRVLDPACGSGNFLYVAIQRLLELEKEVVTFAARPEIGAGLLPRVRPTQLHGIEINPYAAELAQVVIWIGYLQWMRDNGFNFPRDPVLEPLRTIEERDAILAWVDEGGEPIPTWREGAKCAGVADWPEADFVIGNPPFLGSRKAREELGDEYVDAYQEAFRGTLPEGADFCCYWFELARRAILAHRETRAGLLATQGIRGGSSREALRRIATDLVIERAISDRKWVLEDATVRISIVVFCAESDAEPVLDGAPVEQINSDLTGGADLTKARRLAENESIGFQGTISSGPFDIEVETAVELARSPSVGDKRNTEVLRPWINGRDITTRQRGRWIIDFGVNMDEADAAQFERPFELLRQTVKPQRDELRNGQKKYAHSSKYPFWHLWNTRSTMRKRLRDVERFLATARVAKHRLFVWLDKSVLPDAQTIVFARSDDYFFGVLHSCVHELWARRMGTQLREATSGSRYTPTTCFETFPLPWPPGGEPGEGHERRPLLEAIGRAAAELDAQRERWLNPPEYVEPIERAVEREEDFGGVPEEAVPLLKRSAVMARAAKDPNLKQRTLTNLYNQRPTWLRLAHKALDGAVLAAYRAVDPAGGWDPAWAAAYEPFGAGHVTDEKKDDAETKRRKDAAREARAETDEKILAGLLRLNLKRAGERAGE